MSVDLPHLHKVLKDRTRARILGLIEQKGSLSYVEMLNSLEIAHTGKLNYHLKILGDLLSKDDQSGQYSLSEKGKLAVALLGKFENLASPKQVEREASREVAFQEAYGALSFTRYAILFQLLFIFIVGIGYFADLFSPSGVVSIPFAVLALVGIILVLMDYYLVYRKLFSPGVIGQAATPSLILGIIQLVFGGLVAGVFLLIAHGRIMTSKSKVQEMHTSKS